MTRPVIERGTIVIRGNEDRSRRRQRQVSAGAKVIDAAGGDVYPGFIDARTTIGLNEPGPRGFDDVSEMLDSTRSCGAGRVSERQRRDPGRARQRHHHRAAVPDRRADLRRPGRR